MFRKFVLFVFFLMLGVAIFPDVFAWEKNDGADNTLFVKEFLERAKLVDLTWLVVPKEWRTGISLSPNNPEEPEIPEVMEALAKPLPKFRYSMLVLPLSEKHGMDWKLVAAIMAAESNYNPRAISNRGAIGLMQLMPRTAALYRVSYKELFDPEKNIEAGVRHLKKLHNRYDGDLPRVIAAYNSGEGAVDRYKGVPPYRYTKAFVRRVLARYQSHIQKEFVTASTVASPSAFNSIRESLNAVTAYK